MEVELEGSGDEGEGENQNQPKNLDGENVTVSQKGHTETSIDICSPSTAHVTPLPKYLREQ